MAQPELRLATVIPGAVSLGAYEAGALTALLGLIRASQGRIVLDTIVGASAGSITGLILAHSLLTGGGDDDLEELWVDQTTIANLLAGRTRPGRPRAPLSTALLERWARKKLLTGTISRNHESIALVISIANLKGLRYGVAQPESARAIRADTYRDAQAFMLGPDSDLQPVINAALASAANALAFAPVRISRRRADYPSNVEFPGEAADFWYTDGGTVYNVPLGFALDAVFDPEDLGLTLRRFKEARSFVLLTPHPTAPPPRWPAHGDPTFRLTAARAFELARQQSMYDDLRRAEKTNSRILARFRFQAGLQSLLPGDEPLRRVVEDLATWAWSRKREIRGLLGGDQGAGTIEEELARRGEATGVLSQLDFVLDELTGTGGKDEARIEVVSPELEAGETPVTDLLAGEPLLHFFGFLLKQARESDFGLGYRNFRTWWEAFRPDWDVPIPPHRLESMAPAGRLSMRDVRPAVARWWLTFRLGVRYVRELVQG